MLKTLDIPKGSLTWHLVMDGNLIKEISYSGKYTGEECNLVSPTDIKSLNFGDNCICIYRIQENVRSLGFYEFCGCNPGMHETDDTAYHVHIDNAFESVNTGSGIEMILLNTNYSVYNRNGSKSILKDSFLNSKEIVQLNLDAVIPEGVKLFKVCSESLVAVKSLSIPSTLVLVDSFEGIRLAFIRAERFKVSDANMYFSESSNGSLLGGRVGPKLLLFPGDQVGEYVVPEDVITITQFSFAGAFNITSVYVGDYVLCIDSASCISSDYTNCARNIEGYPEKPKDIRIYGCKNVEYIGDSDGYISSSFSKSLVPPNIHECPQGIFEGDIVIYPSSLYVAECEDYFELPKTRVLGVPEPCKKFSNKTKDYVEKTNVFLDLYIGNNRYIKTFYTSKKVTKADIDTLIKKYPHAKDVDVIVLTPEQYDELYSVYRENNGELPMNWASKNAVLGYKGYSSNGKPVMQGYHKTNRPAGKVYMGSDVLSFARNIGADGVFLSTHGNYACQTRTSSSLLDFKAISAITSICKKLCEKESMSLSGWYLLDAQDGMFELGFSGFNGTDVEDCLSLQYSPLIGKFVSRLHPEGVNNKLFNLLSIHIGCVISSLCAIDMPVDLFEVSLGDNLQTPSAGSVLTGVSTICKENGFKEDTLYGKSALLVVIS